MLYAYDDNKDILWECPRLNTFERDFEKQILPLFPKAEITFDWYNKAERFMDWDKLVMGKFQIIDDNSHTNYNGFIYMD